MQTVRAVHLVAAVPFVALAGTLVAQDPEVCVPEIEPVIAVSLATVEGPDLTGVTAKSRLMRDACMGVHTRRISGCGNSNLWCRCSRLVVPKKERRSCEPEPRWKCNKDYGKCKSKSHRDYKKCIRDVNRGKTPTGNG